MAEHQVGPGTLLAGRFRLEDLLDETDGARFWRATDRILARNVAVHVLPQDDRRADALLVAARTSATVTDGHLLRVLDAAEEDGVVYVVNEWGSGMSLDRILADGPLSPRRAAWVVKEVAEAITTAHRSGVAHGRLLPENVMVTEAGSVKLIGFVVDAVLRGRDGLRLPGRAGPLGEHESDVVNLAALLYASLTGRWPGTTGSTLPDAPLEHDHPLRPRQVRAGVPRPLDAICDRVLSPGSHGHAPPIETAHEIFAALADYVGTPNGSGPAGFEPTTALGRPGRETAPDEGPPTQAHAGPAAGAGAAADVDPEQTQAGAPVFHDEDSGVGWMSGPGPRGLRSDDPDAGPRTPPPPPPVLPEPEPRPLFAPDPPEGRAPAPHRSLGGHDTSHTAPVRSTGAGNGSLPRSWGPDADRDEPGDDGGEWATGSWDQEPPGRSWLRLAAAVAALIVLVVALVFAFNLGRGSDDAPTAGPSAGTSETASPSKPVAVDSVSDFDPEGDPPEENPEEAPLAIDGNPSTAWETLTYTRPNLGGLKSGVGLLLDLGKPTRVSQAKIKLLGTGTSLELLAAGKGAAAPTSTAGLDKVAASPSAGTTADLRLDRPVTTRYLVVWLTSLPAASGGYKGQVAEVSLKS